MTHNARRIARLIGQLEDRVTDLEQGRPPDAAERQVENIDRERVGVTDSVTTTKETDLTAQYNTGDEYNSTNYN